MLRWSSRPIASGSPPSVSRIAPPGQYGCGGSDAMQQHRLVDPRAGVGDPRHAPRPAPLAQDVAGQRPAAMDVPEQHPVGVDAEAVDDPGQGGDARPAHLRAQRALGERREATPEHATGAARHRGGAQQLGQFVHELRQRARQPPGQQRLDARRRRAALVVGRRRPVAWHAAEKPTGDAVRRLGEQVAIQVVPVRGPDAIGEPDTGVAHARARGLEPGRQAGQRGRRVERDRGVEAERRVARSAATGARTRRRGCPARR